MKRTILITAVVGALALAPAAEAAVTLDPGTTLKVKCVQRKPMRGLPFTVADTGEEIPRVLKAPGVKAYRLSNHLGGDERAEAEAYVERLRRKTFRISVPDPAVFIPVTWRGC